MYVSCTQESGCTHVAQIKKEARHAKICTQCLHNKICTGLSLKCRRPNAWHNVAHLGEDWSSTNWFFFFFLGIFRRYRLFLVHGVDGGAGTWLCGPEISNRSLSPSLFWWLIAGEIWKRLLCSWQGTWTIDQADVSAKTQCFVTNVIFLNSFFWGFFPTSIANASNLQVPS